MNSKEKIENHLYEDFILSLHALQNHLFDYVVFLLQPNFYFTVFRQHFSVVTPRMNGSKKSKYIYFYFSLWGHKVQGRTNEDRWLQSQRSGKPYTYIFISTSAFEAIKSKGVLMKIADSRVYTVASLMVQPWVLPVEVVYLLGKRYAVFLLFLRTFSFQKNRSLWRNYFRMSVKWFVLLIHRCFTICNIKKKFSFLGFVHYTC